VFNGSPENACVFATAGGGGAVMVNAAELAGTSVPSLAVSV